MDRLEGSGVSGPRPRGLDDVVRDRWWDVLLDSLLPPRCVGCGRRGIEVCAQCIARLRPLGSAICPRCSLPSPAGRVCQRCVRGNPRLRALLAAYPFEGVLRVAIIAFKFQSRTRLARFLVSVLATPLAARPLLVDLVAPVPLSASRLRERGYNQSELLARPLAALRDWPLAPQLIVRTRETDPQTALPARERVKNVRGAFAVTQPDLVAGRRVLLVDDVCTTGATLEACAAPLLDAGAAGVWAVVVARDTLGRQSIS